MSEQFNARWLIQNKVALFEMEGEFDDDKMIAFNELIRDEFLEKGTPPIHCIIDTSKVTSFPRSLITVRKAGEISGRHPNIGWTILVGSNNSMLDFFGGVIAQLLKIKFKTASDLETAKQILKKADPELTI